MFEFSFSAAEETGVIGTVSAISQTIADMHPDISGALITAFGEGLSWFFSPLRIFDRLTSRD